MLNCQVCIFVLQVVSVLFLIIEIFFFQLRCSSANREGTFRLIFCHDMNIEKISTLTNRYNIFRKQKKRKKNTTSCIKYHKYLIIQ